MSGARSDSERCHHYLERHREESGAIGFDVSSEPGVSESVTDDGMCRSLLRRWATGWREGHDDCGSEPDLRTDERESEPGDRCRGRILFRYARGLREFHSK